LQICSIEVILARNQILSHVGKIWP